MILSSPLDVGKYKPEYIPMNYIIIAERILNYDSNCSYKLTRIKNFKNVFNKNKLVQSEQIAKQQVMML